MSQLTNPFHQNPLTTDEELNDIFTLFAPSGRDDRILPQEGSNNKDNDRSACHSLGKGKEPIINKILINKFRSTLSKPGVGKSEAKIEEQDYSEGSFQFKSQDYAFQQKWHNDSQTEMAKLSKTGEDEASFAENSDSSLGDSCLQLLGFTTRETKLFQNDYLKQYRNLISELHLSTKEVAQQITSKPLASSILKLELLGNKTFQIVSGNKKQNQKGKNKSTLGKIRKASKLELKQNKNPNVFKLVPNSYLAKSKEQAFNDLGRGCEWILFKEYFNQIAEQGFRFNKVFNSQAQPDAGLNAKAEQEWVKYKQLNGKFIELQAKQATHMEDNQHFNIDNQALYESVYKVCVSQFCALIGKQQVKEQSKSVSLDDQYLSKVIKRKALGNCKKKFQSVIGSFALFQKKLSMKFLSLSSAFDCKNQQNELKWKKDDPATLAMRHLYDQICEKSQETDIQMKNIPNREQTKQQLKNYMMSYFQFGVANVESQDLEIGQTPSTCPLFLQQSQLDNFILYLKQSHQSLKEKMQKSLGSKVSGRMIYQAENRINEIRLKEQKILRVAYGISTNKIKFKKEEMKYFNKNEDASKKRKEIHILRRGEHETIELNEKRKEGPLSNTNLEMFADASRNNRHREEVDMIRRIKIPSSSKIGNDLSNRLNSQDKSHQNDLNKRNTIKTSSEVYNNGKRSYFNQGDSVRQNGSVLINGHYDEKSKRRLGNSRISEKVKADFEQYVTSLCCKKEQNQKAKEEPNKMNLSLNHKNSSVFVSRVESQGYNHKASRTKNMAMSPTGRRQHKKIIKYSKYPIEVGGCEFVSDCFSSCAILYRVQNVNLKDIQLRFLRDRRRYSINKVKVVVPLGSIRNQQSRKSSDKLENGKSSLQKNSSLLQKTVKLLQILNCLGANVTLEEHQSYSIPQKIQSMEAQITCFMLGENLQKVWEIYSKFDMDQ